MRQYALVAGKGSALAPVALGQGEALLTGLNLPAEHMRICPVANAGIPETNTNTVCGRPTAFVCAGLKLALKSINKICRRGDA